MLLYHGRGKWRYRTLAQLFKNIEPEWALYIPDFSYIYNNLGEVTDEQVEGLNNRFLAASLLALKHAFEKDWLALNTLQILLLAGNAPDHLQKPFVIYLFGRSELKAAEVIKLFESLSLDYKNKFMSTLDYLKQEGKKEGIQEGIQEGIEIKSIEFVKNLLLADKFSIIEIAGLANVSEAFVLKVKEML